MAEPLQHRVPVSDVYAKSYKEGRWQFRLVSRCACSNQENLQLREKVSNNRFGSRQEDSGRQTLRNCPRLETSPGKPFVRLTQQTGVSASPVINATQLLHKHSYTRTVHKLYVVNQKEFCELVPPRGARWRNGLKTHSIWRQRLWALFIFVRS
jgi:hypothetical protein